MLPSLVVDVHDARLDVHDARWWVTRQHAQIG